MRSGESLVAMTPDQLRTILLENEPDFSAQVCPHADLGHLSLKAISLLRQLWHKKTGNGNLLIMDNERLLRDAELLTDSGLTLAGLILLGEHSALGRYLPQAELIFEYRTNETDTHYAQRKEFREGFLLFMDDLWNLVDARNEVQHYQDGLFVWDIRTFNEIVVREAILNAVCHRDYRLGGSVFIRQCHRYLQITSPGSFPDGITPENILHRQSPRNRRVAETLAKIGLAERSGQGADRMFKESIREGKGIPDYSDSDAYTVSLRLNGQVNDPAFLRFLEKIGAATRERFAAEDFLVLDLVHREQRLPKPLAHRANRLCELGALERIGSGRGSRFIFSRRLYEHLGKRGVHTRKSGLDRNTNKELLFKHIRVNSELGSTFTEFWQVLPSLSRGQIQVLLKELRRENRIHCIGFKRGARWHASERIK